MNKAKEQTMLLLASSATIQQIKQFLTNVLKLGITYAYVYYLGRALQYPVWNHVNEQKGY